MEKIHLTEDQWREKLSPEQYKILREQGTEPAFHNAYHSNKQEGVYLCAGCQLPLYNSDSKYDSGTGWPSFWQPISQENLELHKENDTAFPRTEVTCSRCGGHLGHVFNDGPQPTGKRYCMNSGALKFTPKK